MGIGVAALFHPAMLALAVAAGTASKEAQPDALYTWEVALTRFQEAGALIGAGEYDRAKAALSAIAQELPWPYSRTAMECRQRIRSVPRERMTLHGYYHLGGLGMACLELHAHKEAVQLWRQAIEAHPKDHNRIRSRIAWCLLESGAIEEALAEYRKRLAGCKLSDVRSYYETQIELITQRQEKQDDASFAKEYIRKHYLPTHPSFRKDYLGALKELKRVLPYAKDEQERLSLYWLFVDCLSGLGDEDGRLAWENKLLNDFKDNPDACARVYVSRGERAHKKKKLDEALANYLKAATDYRRSRSYGMAQYNVGIVLKEREEYDEAIAEFFKLLSSDVDDRDPGADIMEVYRNYRHKAALRISECYEAKHDFARALEYALLARDKHQYRTWCGTCAKSAEDALTKRIERLQLLAKSRK